MTFEHIINEDLLNIDNDFISLISPISLRVLSSAVCGSGFGHYKSFINRHVHKDYNISNHIRDMESFIQKHGFNVNNTVGMMTAVKIKDVAFKLYKTKTFSIFVVITAGVGNAVDSTKAHHYTRNQHVGTINTWIFVNGVLTDEAFVQAIITATEAKTKALHDLHVLDPISKTIATGTSTDSILIAATQRGEKLTYAGTATPLGQLIGLSIYNETKRAILNGKNDTN